MPIELLAFTVFFIISYFTMFKLVFIHDEQYVNDKLKALALRRLSGLQDNINIK